MTEAIFGLLGVVVGALVTAWSERAMHHRKERQLRQLAARALFDDLITFQASVHQALEHADVTMVDDGTPIGAIWREHRAALAAVRWDAWTTIQAGVLVAESFPRDLPEPEEPTDPKVVAGALVELEEHVDAAVTALLPHVGR